VFVWFAHPFRSLAGPIWIQISWTAKIVVLRK
jgi:hypothetical protein